MSNNLRYLSVLFVWWFYFSTALLPGRAQTHKPNQTKHVGVAHLQDMETRFGPHFTAHLSAGGANVFHVARALSTMHSGGKALRPSRQEHHEMMLQAQGKLLAGASQPGIAGANGLVRVNDASFDFDSSRFTGYTQSETSSAWCGKNIVVGFNDSAAFAHSVLQHQAPAISLNGVAVSHDNGKSFVGLPFVNPGPALDPSSGFFDSQLAGDPSLICTDPQHFVYASIQTQIPVDSQGNVLAAFAEMAVSRSSDGGVTWEDPITVAKKDLNFHFLDKEWLAVDPHHPNRMYLTYTDFQNHGTEDDCTGGSGDIGGGPDVALEMVSSKDGGLTWGPPTRFARRCALTVFSNLTGTQVAVGPNGEVYVAYTWTDDGGRLAEIRFRRSDDAGQTFGPEIVAGTAVPAATPVAGGLQGNFRTNSDPTLVVDNSSGPRRGTVYLVWTDASRHSFQDVWGGAFDFNSDPTFSFGDIVISHSLDRGNTWSTAKPVSPVPANFQGSGRDQFMAGAAVDVQGTLGICYSDRRNDPNNFLVDHYCSLSADGGNSFRDIRETPVSWTPNANNDIIINPAYMGDYDAMSMDASGATPGFFSTFQIVTRGNPDVFGIKLQ